MRHKDIYEKFMIEYDKALIVSSYPSLTTYEIANLLDKAYLALIAQKFTGNNPRLVGFEGDIKAIEDIRPLMSTCELDDCGVSEYVSNELIFTIPENIDYLYYISGDLCTASENNAIDNKDHSHTSVLLVSHEVANNFKNSFVNLPWIKDPVCYLDERGIHVLVDTYEIGEYLENSKFQLTYIKKPQLFVADETENSSIADSSVEFELNDAVAEEMINLAIILSAEIVESQRTSTKVQLRPLES